MRHHTSARHSLNIETLETRALLSSVSPAFIYPTQAQSSTETASASIVATQLTATEYQYSISLKNTATGRATAANQIGTLWYAWVPGEDFLSTAPVSVASPAGWTSNIVHAGSSDGFSIQWVATSNFVKAGKSLNTFSFVSTDTPTQVFGSSSFFPTTAVNTAFVYAGAPEADAGFKLSPATATSNPSGPAVEKASATIAVSQLTATTFQYSITVKDISHGRPGLANQIGTFWYAWVPNDNFLLSTPLSVSSPAGWTSMVNHTDPGDGFGIEWSSTTSAIQAGKSLGGFVFTSTDTPAQVFGHSATNPTKLVNTSFVYSGAAEADPGSEVTVVPSVNNPTGALLPTLIASPEVTATTIPANGDVNPYGVAFVPRGFAPGGSTAAGDVLVSNFNNAANLQGTGSTIVSITPAGATSLFYQGPAGVGLTTALGVLRSGFVLVGNVPSTDGTSATVGQGSLIVLDRSGHQVASFTDPALLDGPWDLAVVDGGASARVFVSSVLSGTVTRLNLKLSARNDTASIVSQTQIASGYKHGPDPAAFELGPTGLVFARNQLFVASTDDNAIYAVPSAATRKTDAGTGTLIYKDDAHLRGPLALVVAPNGDLIAANGDAVNGDPTQGSELVEFTPIGQFVAQVPVDPAGQGGAFGIAISAPGGSTVQFAAVDDLTNSLDIWTINRKLLKKH